MTEQLNAFLQFLRLNHNASVHTVRAYASDLSQLLAHAAGRAGVKRIALQPAHLDRAEIRAFLASLQRAGAVAGDGGAQAGRRTDVPPLSAAGRGHRHRSGRADWHTEARGAHAGAPVRGGDGGADCGAGRRWAARPPRPRDSRAVLRVGVTPQRAGRARSRRCESEREDGAGAGQRRQAAAGAVQHQHRHGDPHVSAGSRAADPSRSGQSRRSPAGASGSRRTVACGNRCS